VVENISFPGVFFYHLFASVSLPVDEEGARLRFDFEAELVRLKAA
jgi:hypothetical protein